MAAPQLKLIRSAREEQLTSQADVSVTRLPLQAGHLRPSRKSLLAALRALPDQLWLTMTVTDLRGLLGDDAPSESMTVEEIARATRRGSGAVRHWIRTGQLPASRVGKGYLVRRADFDAFLDTRRSARREEPRAVGLEPAELRMDAGSWRRVRRRTRSR